MTHAVRNAFEQQQDSTAGGYAQPLQHLLEATQERGERLQFGFGPNPHPYAALLSVQEPKDTVHVGKTLADAIATAAAAAVAAAEGRAKAADERAEGLCARNAELQVCVCVRDVFLILYR